MCSTRFDKSSPFDVEAAEEGFCLLKDFRLGGTALGEAVLTNSTDECHAKCSQQGSKVRLYIFLNITHALTLPFYMCYV